MELYQLEYLVALDEYKTILKAAEHLHVSQPSITKAIKKLEDEFGFPLFDRVKNRLILNEYGKEAIKHARIVLEEMNELKVSTNALYQSNLTLKIGSIAPAPVWKIESLTDKKIESTLYEDTEALLTDFRKHLYSMIILDYPIYDKQCICHKICDEQLYIGVNSTHVIANKKSVTFDDINGYNFLLVKDVGYWYDIVKEKLTLSKFLVQENEETYNILCASTDIPVFRTNLTIPFMKDRENKVYIPITDTEASLSFYGIYNKNQQHIYDEILEKEDD